MNILSFIEVRETVAQWIKSNEERLKDRSIELEILIDNENCLRIELRFKWCLAGIIVEEPDWAPYRYVFFEAWGIAKKGPDFSYFWYDEEETTVEEIIENLDKAVDVVFEYNSKI